MDESVFMEVGGLTSDGSPLGDFINLLTKVGSLTKGNRLLHYLIAYILLQHNTNHAQPTVNDSKMMFAIREGIMVIWPLEILKVMSGIDLSSSRLLAYEIFISRFIDHLGIYTFDTDIMVVNSREHLVGGNLIHKMGIYKYGVVWMYHEDHNTTIDFDMSDEDQARNNVARRQICVKKFLLGELTRRQWNNP
ncbi:hypothetical protein Lal_00013361 [Lupinus albus]|nr:hypothetical protein Lal_00013361 [Lupinus albus]